MNKKSASAEELDRIFDSGSDELDDYLDWDSAVRINAVPKRVNVDFPQWMVMKLDREAKRLGITRQALIKTWVADRIDKAA
jgi:hypothetical protein